jgi:hypothetical protein
MKISLLENNLLKSKYPKLLGMMTMMRIESDEREGQKFNMDLGDFNMKNNLNFLFDEHEDLDYEI